MGYTPKNGMDSIFLLSPLEKLSFLAQFCCGKSKRKLSKKTIVCLHRYPRVIRNDYQIITKKFSVVFNAVVY